MAEDDLEEIGMALDSGQLGAMAVLSLMGVIALAVFAACAIAYGLHSAFPAAF